jgi:hypothetical protein
MVRARAGEARTASNADLLSGRLRIGHPRVEGSISLHLHRPSVRLVKRLRSAHSPIAVTAHTENDDERASKLLPKARAVRMTFGPEPDYDGRAIEAWRADDHGS